MFSFDKPPTEGDLCRSRFMKAVRAQNIQGMRSRVKLGINVNFCDQLSSKYPLHVATSLGNEEAVELLLDANADVAIKDTQLNTVLHTAVVQPNTKLTARLAQAGCPLEECNCRGETVLLKAARRFEAHMHIPTLLAFKCRADAVAPETGQTSLHFAVQQNADIATVKKLVAS